MGLVGQETPVIVSVHDCQVVNEPVPTPSTTSLSTWIVTPSEVVRCSPLAQAVRTRLGPDAREFAATRPYIREVRRLR